MRLAPRAVAPPPGRPPRASGARRRAAPCSRPPRRAPPRAACTRAPSCTRAARRYALPSPRTRLREPEPVPQLVGQLLGLLEVARAAFAGVAEAVVRLAEVREDERDAVAVARLLRDLVRLLEEARAPSCRRACPARPCRGCSSEMLTPTRSPISRRMRSACSNASSARLVLARVLVDEAEVVERERDARAVAELAAHGERPLRVLERQRGSRPGASGACRCRRACSRCRARPAPARRARAPRELAARFVEAPRLAVEAPDARVRRAALAPQIEPPRARRASRRRRGTPRRCARAPGARRRGGAAPSARRSSSAWSHCSRSCEALRVELGGLGVGVARARDVARLDVRRRRRAPPRPPSRGGAPASRGTPRCASTLLAEREPLGDGPVVAARRRRRRQPHERLALEVVLEDVLLVAGEGAVGQAQDVVALDEVRRGAGGRRRRPRRLAAFPHLRRRLASCRWIATSPPSQKTPPIAAARSRSSRSSGASAAMRACTASSTVSGSFTEASFSAWTLQRSSLEVVGRLEHAACRGRCGPSARGAPGCRPRASPPRRRAPRRPRPPPHGARRSLHHAPPRRCR